jgi:hypothetical protein
MEISSQSRISLPSSDDGMLGIWDRPRSELCQHVWIPSSGFPSGFEAVALPANGLGPCHFGHNLPHGLTFQVIAGRYPQAGGLDCTHVSGLVGGETTRPDQYNRTRRYCVLSCRSTILETRPCMTSPLLRTPWRASAPQTPRSGVFRKISTI